MTEKKRKEVCGINMEFKREKTQMLTFTRSTKKKKRQRQRTKQTLSCGCHFGSWLQFVVFQLVSRSLFATKVTRVAVVVTISRNAFLFIIFK